VTFFDGPVGRGGEDRPGRRGIAAPAISEEACKVLASELARTFRAGRRRSRRGAGRRAGIANHFEVREDDAIVATALAAGALSICRSRLRF
jgi:hypothetical protein